MVGTGAAVLGPAVAVFFGATVVELPLLRTGAFLDGRARFTPLSDVEAGGVALATGGPIVSAAVCVAGGAGSGVEGGELAATSVGGDAVAVWDGSGVVRAAVSVAGAGGDEVDVSGGTAGAVAVDATEVPVRGGAAVFVAAPC